MYSMDYSKIDKKSLQEKGKHYVGWYASTKFDGWRITYDPKTQTMRTKGGNVCKGVSFIADELAKKKYPQVEGELYLGRRFRSKVASVCAGKMELPPGTKLEYLVFDMPSCKLPFLERQRELSELVKLKPVRMVKAVRQVRVKSIAHLRSMFINVVENGGEGLVLADPSALYAKGRSKSKVKLKGRPDAEATVVGHKRGEKGQLILKAITEQGVSFYVGSGLSHGASERDFPLETLITYEFENLSIDGVPQQTSFVAIRPIADLRK